MLKAYMYSFYTWSPQFYSHLVETCSDPTSPLSAFFILFFIFVFIFSLSTHFDTCVSLHKARMIFPLPQPLPALIPPHSPLCSNTVYFVTCRARRCTVVRADFDVGAAVAVVWVFPSSWIGDSCKPGTAERTR